MVRRHALIPLMLTTILAVACEAHTGGPAHPRDAEVDDEGLTSLLGSAAPARPAPDLVDRIMRGVPPAAAAESAIDRWIRVAWPMALVGGAAATILGLVLWMRPPAEAIDPVSALAADPDIDLGRVLGLPR